MNMYHRILWVSLFAIAFAFVEASVVVYLRMLYYPHGFEFPLKFTPDFPLIVEIAREFSTIIMLGAAGIIAGTTRWSKFAYFAIAFGVWDIFYYVWLKVTLDWPSSLLDWDVLFLIPFPWIGPVIAPVLISLVLMLAGWLILQRERNGEVYKPGKRAWMLSILGSLIILFSFTYDIDATLRMQMPMPYWYELFAIGFVLYGVALYFAMKHKQ
ncbi:MAG: hypothetical protein L0Y80_06520 [Ignavibacteriae bacterium]|nr:hypothetical protein [Ignavibacteriota bacterium]